MTLPVGRSGQALAVVIAVMVLAIAYLALAQPLLGLFDARSREFEALGDQRARLERLEIELPRLEAQARSLRGRAAGKNDFFTERSDPIAAASLQTGLQAIVSAAGGEVRTVESLPARVQDGYRRVGVRAALVGDINNLTGILAAIAEARPFLFVDNLEVRSGGLREAAKSDAAAPLSITFELYGFRADDVRTAAQAAP